MPTKVLWHAAFSLFVFTLTAGASAQSKPDDLTITTSDGIFRLVPLSSLLNDSAVSSAERVVELALPAAQKDATEAKKALDKIDEDIARNFAAMQKEKETLATPRLALEPTMDAYNKQL